MKPPEPRTQAERKEGGVSPGEDPPSMVSLCFLTAHKTAATAHCSCHPGAPAVPALSSLTDPSFLKSLLTEYLVIAMSKVTTPRQENLDE